MNGVAIAGKAGAGKNAFADVLSVELIRRGQWPVQMGFAEGPKAELWETRGLKKEDEGGRDALVDLAHTRRGADPHYWVNVVAGRVGSLRPFGVIPIITDMRYFNELEWSARSDFVSVRVDATWHDRVVVLTERGEDPDFAGSEHPSECELDEASFDVRFWNDHGRLYVLERQAIYVADVLLGDVETLVA